MVGDVGDMGGMKGVPILVVSSIVLHVSGIVNVCVSIIVEFSELLSYEHGTLHDRDKPTVYGITAHAGYASGLHIEFLQDQTAVTHARRLQNIFEIIPTGHASIHFNYLHSKLIL